MNSNISNLSCELLSAEDDPNEVRRQGAPEALDRWSSLGQVLALTATAFAAKVRPREGLPAFYHTSQAEHR